MIGNIRKICATYLVGCLLWVPGAYAARVLDKNIGWPGRTLEGIPCTGVGQGYGPYDYMDETQRRERLPIVESAHFTTSVQELIKGNTGTLFGDLDYTLRAFPNHHPALYAMIKLNLRGDKVATPAECYLQRANVFNPNDGTALFLFGIYLHRVHRLNQALVRYQQALQYMPDGVELNYNLGLLYADMGKYEEAMKHAKVAYGHGYPLPGLKQKLREKGYWHETEVESK